MFKKFLEDVSKKSYKPTNVSWVLAIEWFEDNDMNLNEVKYRLLVSRHQHGNISVKFGQIDTTLTDMSHQKLSVSAEVTNFMSLNQT